MIVFGQSDFLQALGWAVFNSIWQMAFLWIIFNVLISLPRSVRPAYKNSLAVILLFAGFAWFIFTFTSIYINRENNNGFITLTGLPVDINERLNKGLITFLPIASLLYILFLLIPVTRFIQNYRYVQVLKKNSLSKINVEWRMFVRRVTGQIGIHRQVNIWLSNLVTSPVTVGFFKPIILVPLAAMANLTSQQMEAVLLHELAHVKRHDYLINLVIVLIKSVLYFNPFVIAFVKTVEREREKSCDEMVMQFQYDPHNYAAALLLLEKSRMVPQNMAIGATSGKNDLLKRVERILKIESASLFTFNKLAGLFSALICIILLNTLIAVSKPMAGNENNQLAFEQTVTPFFLFSNDKENLAKETIDASAQPPVNEKNEKHSIHITNQATTTKAERKIIAKDEPKNIPAPPAPVFANVKTVFEAEPVRLNKREIKHVEKTVEATKKIVEDVQWKEIEKSIADVMTEPEKNVVKKKYDIELERLNWKKLEDKLKASYDQLNWEKINNRVSSALTAIQLDSLIHLYSILNENLDKAEKMDTTPGDPYLIAVPLPDVSIETIQQRKAQAEKVLSRLKALRSGKIIHL